MFTSNPIILAVDEAVDEIFKQHKFITVDDICFLTGYSYNEIDTALSLEYSIYNRTLKNSVKEYIEEKWYWKLLYAYKFFKNKTDKERVIAFLEKYNLTLDFAEHFIKTHKISAPEFYLFRASVVDYLNKREKEKHLSQNDILSIARDLSVETIKDENTGAINTIWISKRFLEQETLKSFGISCIEVEILKTPKEILSNKPENFPKDNLSNIGDDGIVKVGSYVRGGDILVAKQMQLKKPYFNQYYKNTSVCLSTMLEGVVVDVIVKSKNKGDTLKGRTEQLISIFIELQATVTVGDVFADKNGVKGVVCGIVDREDIDIITNFSFDGTEIKRILSTTRPNLFYVRGTGNYSAFNDKPIGTGFKSPVFLSGVELKKFAQTGYFSVLQNLYTCIEPKIREKISRLERMSVWEGKDNCPIEELDLSVRTYNGLKRIRCNTFKELKALTKEQLQDIRDGGKIYEEVLEVLKHCDGIQYNNLTEGKGIKHVNICNGYNIRQYLMLLRALGVDIQLSSEKIIDDKYEYGINDEDLSITLSPVTDEDILNISMGEVTEEYEVFNRYSGEAVKNGLFDPYIFGKYTISTRERMGHIELPIKYQNFLFPQIELSKILVYPSHYRNFQAKSEGGYTVENFSHSAYYTVVRAVKAIGRSYITEEIEKMYYERLKDSIQGLFVGDLFKPLSQSVDGYNGLFADIFDRLDGFFTNMPIDYSASLRATVSNKLKRGECLLPWVVVREIFGNKIKQWIIENSLIETVEEKNDDLLDIFGKDFYKDLEEIGADRYLKGNPESQELIDLVNKRLLNERVLVFSRADSGDIIELKLQATLEYKSVIILNAEDYRNINTEVEKAVKIVYSPLGYIKSTIDSKRIHNFCTFIDVFFKEKISTAEKVACLKKWISTLQDKNTVNSLAFCLITGRRANEAERKELIEPFVVFDSDKEQRQKDIEKRREDEECRQRETEFFDDLFSSKDYSENGDCDDLFGDDNDEDDDFGFSSLFDDDDEEF